MRVRWRRVLVPIAIVLLLLALGHYYVWLRLFHATRLPMPWPLIGALVLALLALPIPGTFYTSRTLSSAAATLLVWLGYTWMGLGLYLILALAVSDLARVGVDLGGGARPDPRLVAPIAVMVAAAIALWGLARVSAFRRAARARAARDASRIAAAGYTIVQLTDVHIGPTLGRAFAERVASAANALDPDLIVITGDLVDGMVDSLREHAAPLGKLRAKDGVYFVTGNHEYYW